jgi:hypothetical protein
MNEQALAHRVRDRLNALRNAGLQIWWLKVHGGPYQRAGVPDFLLCVCGRFAAVELKNPERPEAPSPSQAAEISWVQRAGGRAIVATSVAEIDLLIRQLAGLDELPATR